MKLSRKLKAKSQVRRIFRNMDMTSVAMIASADHVAFTHAGLRKIDLSSRAK